MDKKGTENRVVGAAMVVGGGIGGMQAAIDLAESGIKVFLVEKSSSIGGRMVQLDKTFPTDECAMCIVSPKLVECGRHLNIEIITNSQIENISGQAGNFEITLYKKARYIDPDKCTACEECSLACPVEIASKFNSAVGTRSAIYRRYPQAVPSTFVIDKEERSPCVIKCPANINIQGYVALAARNKYKEAFELIRHQVPLPGVLGRVCYHPCESECHRKNIESSLAINPIKRFICDFVYNNKKSVFAVNDDSDAPEDALQKEDKAQPRKSPYSWDSDVPEDILEKRKKQKIAVIGAGPCGLTAANDLALQGYAVTLFEKENRLGGMLAFGIPAYRLPKDILQHEVDEILKTGIEVKSGLSLGEDFTIRDLEKQGYEVVLLATGTGKGRELNVPGAAHKSVWQGVDFLNKINGNEKLNIKGTLLVIGGGNVAIDVARAAIRLGTAEVQLACLECLDDMPAHPWEIDLAKEEGVTIHPSLKPMEIFSRNGAVTGVGLIRCLRVFDEEGKFNPVCDEQESHLIEAENVVVAIGQYADTSYLKKDDSIGKSNSGTLITDSLTYQTTQEGIFAAGDLASGPASAIEAIASGKEAAISISRYLDGLDMKEGRGREKEAAAMTEADIKKQERVNVSLVPVEERIRDFREVELTLSEEEAVSEATRCLNCGICSECLECEKVCEPKAINHKMKDERIKLNVGAVVVAPGVSLFDAKGKKEYGFDRYENVIDSIQFERILSSSGPTKGEVSRPSDGKHPERIAFIQCVGSRDLTCGNEFCSSVCCMYSMKQAVIAREHDARIKPTIFYIDIRSFGKDFERYYNSAKNDKGVDFIRCMVSKIYEKSNSKNLKVKYIDEKGKIQEAEFDLVVLAVGLTDTEEIKPLMEKLSVETDAHGFMKTNRNYPGCTSQAGIYVAGTSAEPKDIPETVTDGSLAASLASALLKNSRGTLVKKKEYPPEKDVSDEDLRIGVFVCRCGRNIASVVDVQAVVEHAGGLNDVAYAGEFLYTCSKDALDTMKEKVLEHDLNRVVVASCTPRTHEELFRDTIRDAGLNKYLFEMISLREHVSWVHKDHPELATEKSKELVGMVVAKTRLINPLKPEFCDVSPGALVIGGGASGMQAALGVAEQGYEVFLIEKEERLGGHLREIFNNLEEDPQQFLTQLIEKVTAHEKITVMLTTKAKEFSGFAGNYITTIVSSGKEEEIQHGVVIIATGAAAYIPEQGEFGYQEHAGIITQVKLEEALAKNPADFSREQTFVMIQCVGSRNEQHPYCSRFCCMHAIKNAIKLKSINPEHEVVVLYRDVRSYGFLEKYYLQAREAGVVFLCYDVENEPEVTVEKDKIFVKHKDALMQDVIVFNPDHLILSTGVSSAENDELAKIIKVPLNMDGFFMEAHPKIRPLDFTSEGIFFCGLAHSPRFLHESLAQARGASVRAVTILSKNELEAKAIIATVNERVCRGCGLCVSVCPFNARELDDETKIATVIDVMCQGCGTCAAACPSGATAHKKFNKRQIMSIIDEAL